MPISLPNTTTTDNFPNFGSTGAIVAGTDVLDRGYFVVANAPVFIQYFYGAFGQEDPSPQFFASPASYSLTTKPGDKPVAGIRYRSAAAGIPAQVFGAFFYPKDPVLEASSEFTANVSATGGTSPTIPNLNVTATQAGNKAPGGTYTITAPNAGTYIVEWGCAGYSQSGLGDTGTISCSVSGVVNFHGSTAGSGGDALDTPINLTAGQIITFTVGGTVTSLNGCWARLIQIA